MLPTGVMLPAKKRFPWGDLPALRGLGLLGVGVGGASEITHVQACCGRRCTRSVGITPLLIGCSAT